MIINGAEAVAGEVLVKFLRPLSEGEETQLETQADADEQGEIGGAGARRIHSRSYSTEELLAFLRTDGRVVYAEPNYIVRANLTPNDTYFNLLWGLLNTGQTILEVPGTAGADIRAEPAWDETTGSRATVVGVIDTGIDYTHPDPAANVWSAPASFTVNIGGKRIRCKKGTHGFNAITNRCNPRDDHYHGTHVSGTIGAVGNNGIGVVGVNWTASIMGIKFLDASGSGTTAGAINAIAFALQAKQIFGADANVRVLSNSWDGGGFSQALLDEINLANTNDILFVAAAGNSGVNNDSVPHYPSTYNTPNMVAVAATDNNDGLASFSNYGPTTVDLGAPGVNVASTVPGAFGSYAYLSGTSMATPEFSGAAALVLSKCTLNTAALIENLLDNVDPIPSLAGITLTGGRLNVDKAIRACSAPPTPDFSLTTSPSSATVTAGSPANYTVAITRLNGFTDAVDFVITGLPSGASGGFNPASTSGDSSALTVTTTGAPLPGSYVFTVTGTGGGLTRMSTATLVVEAAPVPDFSLSASPASQSVVQGVSTSYAVSIARSGGFIDAVNFTISGLPTDASGIFSPNDTTGDSSTLSVSTSTSTPRGSYLFTVTGMRGALTRTTTATLA